MPPYQIEWLEEARADVRALDREAAMRIFDGVLHFARAGSGDLKTLHGALSGSLRLRVGDYRVLFKLEGNIMQIFGVRHRGVAYRK